MTGTSSTTSIEQVVEDYFAMWNEVDTERRRTIIAETWTPDARYKDPMVAADGQDGLVAMVAAVHEQFPGHRFHLTSAIDAYQDRARWGWELVGPDDVIAAGVDFAALTTDGCLSEVIGFLEQPDS